MEEPSHRPVAGLFRTPLGVGPYFTMAILRVTVRPKPSTRYR